MVFEEGAAAAAFFVLTEGHLRVAKITSDGKQVVIRHIGVGEIFSIAAAIGRDTYPATAIAVVDSVALAWPSSAWARLASKVPALSRNTLHTVGGRLQDAHAVVMELSTQEVERRIAHALLRMIERSGRPTDRGILIEFPISRQDIAEMTGTTLHTASRVLSAWEANGLVVSGRQRIAVREPAQLRLLAHHERS